MNPKPSAFVGTPDEPPMSLEEASAAILDTVTTINRIAQKIKLIDQIASKDGAMAFHAAIDASSARPHLSASETMLEVQRLAKRSEIAALEIGNLADFSSDIAARAGVLLEEMMSCIGRATDLLHGASPAGLDDRHG